MILTEPSILNKMSNIQGQHFSKDAQECPLQIYYIRKSNKNRFSLKCQSTFSARVHNNSEHFFYMKIRLLHEKGHTVVMNAFEA